ncbi:uncharacterized protein (TIGR00299 family) protein/uncharacterized protein (TIGR00268 family) [Clostridium sardiniense]|nr:uncharacterized protein (TIGR00299 family) protein/uncharacterized protein (TIGR00268 family) [Clostridium sardiniense]
MRVLYYDCFSGISGDMNLGALVDLGVPSEYLINELSKLSINDEFRISIKKSVKQGITGISVIIDDNILHNVLENHHNHHHGRSYSDIKDIILKSNLNDNIKMMALRIFDQVAIAEGKVHNKNIDEVHFHEVGAVDSIIDIVGAAICIDYLNVDSIISSPIELGYGVLKCAHGILPIPAPATAEILRGVPIIAKNAPFEATTPTGAAILKALSSKFTYEKDFEIKHIGYGLGCKEGVNMPNVLRAMIGESKETSSKEYVIECNIDDMIGEEFDLLMERLFQKGALDVFYTPIFMKKGRPAYKLSVICNNKNLEELKKIIFLNSSTIGLRQYEVLRDKLKRKEEIIKCEFGDVPVKVAFYDGKVSNIKPEYEVCKKIAKAKCIALGEVRREVIKSYSKNKSSNIKSVDNNKINNLKEYIKDLRKVAIAFSGGVDSTFLVKVCKDVLKENAVAITIASPYIPKWEIEEAKELTASLGIEHIIIDMPIAEEIKFNPKDRCYKCKKKVFSKIIEKANSLGIVNIIDGTNKDDESDYRPGMVALKELKIKSPLLELGFGKDDIRSHSKELNLPTWSKPAYACLLTRLQIGEEITEEKLDRTEKAEVFISSLGIKGIRVRNHGELARIEVQPKDIENILDKEILESIALELKAIGYKYITLDIEGYKVGSLN